MEVRLNGEETERKWRWKEDETKEKDRKEGRAKQYEVIANGFGRERQGRRNEEGRNIISRWNGEKKERHGDQKNREWRGMKRKWLCK